MKKFHDSPLDVENILIEGYRKMTPQQKMQRVSELNKAVQQLALARIQKQYRNISEREKKLRLASIWPVRRILS